MDPQLAGQVSLDQFILFGDSITQGAWNQVAGFGLGAELQNAYVRRMDVVNRGYSGYNTDNALEVIPKILPKPEWARVRFLAIWFGANDANKNLAYKQFVPADRFKKNLLEIIQHPALKAHSPNIILITTPPFEETILKKMKDQMGANKFTCQGETRKAKDAAEYAQLVREVGKDAGVPVLDIWTAFMDKAGWKAGDHLPLPGSIELGKSAELGEMLPDGLHLSAQGYKLVFEELKKLLKEKWPEYPLYKMPYAVKVDWEREWGSGYWDVENDAIA